MKKLALVFITLIAILSLVACSSNQVDSVKFPTCENVTFEDSNADHSSYEHVVLEDSSTDCSTHEDVVLEDSCTDCSTYEDVVLENNDVKSNDNIIESGYSIRKPELSVEEAIEVFRENPYADIDGFSLHANGDVYMKLEHIVPGIIFNLEYVCVGNIHYATTPSGNCIYATTEAAFFRDGNIVTKCSLGNITTISIPESATYIGCSFWCGLIFKDGSDVYSVKEQTTLIATDVAYIIDTDYALTSDAWSQPIFLMKDGTIKSFLSWDGIKGELVTPYFEGGYQ